MSTFLHELAQDYPSISSLEGVDYSIQCINEQVPHPRITFTQADATCLPERPEYQLILDKSTLDTLMHREDGIDAVTKMVEWVSTHVDVGGVYVVVSQLRVDNEYLQTVVLAALVDLSETCRWEVHAHVSDNSLEYGEDEEEVDQSNDVPTVYIFKKKPVHQMNTRHGSGTTANGEVEMLVHEY